MIASFISLILISGVSTRASVIHESKEDCDRIAKAYRCSDPIWIESEHKCLFYECLERYNTCKSGCSYGITKGIKARSNFYDCAP